MTDQLETLPPDAKIDDLLGVFDRGRVAIVMDGDKFLGLITEAICFPICAGTCRSRRSSASLVENRSRAQGSAEVSTFRSG